MWIEMRQKVDIQKVMIESCLGVSDRIQELLLEPFVCNFLNNDVEMSGSDNDFHHRLKFCTGIMTEE